MSSESLDKRRDLLESYGFKLDTSERDFVSYVCDWLDIEYIQCLLFDDGIDIYKKNKYNELIFIHTYSVPEFIKFMEITQRKIKLEKIINGIRR